MYRTYIRAGYMLPPEMQPPYGAVQDGMEGPAINRPAKRVPA